MSYDNLCKMLSEKYPERFASWILGTPQPTARVLKTELSIEPIRADSVTFLQTAERILHLEFQSRWETEPPIPLRMIDYWVRLYRLHRVPITQVVILLLPPTDETVIENVFAVEQTRHEFQILRMWEQDPALFLEDEILLPFAPLTATSAPEQLLAQSAQRVNQIESMEQRREVSSYTQLLAGLKFNKELIRRIFREDMMRESVIYQEIYQEGEQEGIQSDRRTTVESLLQSRFGELDEDLQMLVQSLLALSPQEYAQSLLQLSTLSREELRLQFSSQ